MQATNQIGSILSVLSNQWVVGIGGGILSGLTVSFIVHLIFSRKENREYLQKVLSANREVLFSLRPLITESAFPSVGVIDALIAATSRRYLVKKEDMSSAVQFFDDLIKEVMDSSFVPHKKKSDFCTHLIELKIEATATTQPQPIAAEAMSLSMSRREAMVNILSLAIGLMVMFTTFIFTFGAPQAHLFLNSNPFSLVLLPFGVALVGLLLTVALMYIFKVLERKSGFQFGNKELVSENIKDDLLP